MLGICSHYVTWGQAEQSIKAHNTALEIVRHRVTSRCLNYIPTDGCASESDITTAFEGVRQHTSSGEPFFSEQSSHLIPSTMTIPVDSRGIAHVYETAAAKTPLTENRPDTDDNHVIPESRWLCNADMCAITSSQINGTIKLLKALVSPHPVNITDFYININKCSNENSNSSKLGHLVHCSEETPCTSILHPARTLSCHFPYLRSLIRRIYVALHCFFCVQ